MGNARMGKGKGSIDRLVSYIKEGQVILEIILKRNLNNDRQLMHILKQCDIKFPVKLKTFTAKK
jgi:ribosomal protein L16/L10AE